MSSAGRDRAWRAARVASTLLLALAIAMGMARAGFSYTDILHHYYTDVHLVDLGTLDFFRDEELQRGMGGGPERHQQRRIHPR